jgi:hypothetical protein
MKVEPILHLLAAVAPLVSITHGLAPLGVSQILSPPLPTPKLEPDVITTVYVYFSTITPTPSIPTSFITLATPAPISPPRPVALSFIRQQKVGVFEFGRLGFIGLW